MAILGDSFIEAYQVEREETLAARLEPRLPGVEAFEFGRSAHSITRQIAILDMLPRLLADERGPDLPDIVAFQIHGPFSFRQALADEVLRPALWRRALIYGINLVRIPSRIVAAVKASVLGRLVEPTTELMAEADRVMDRGHRSDVGEQGWAVLDRSVRQLADRARALRIRPVFFYLPMFDDLWQESAATDPGIPARRFRDMARRAGADFVDLTGDFRRAIAAGEKPLHFPRDNHLTPLGHEVAARGLAAALRPMLEGR